MYLQVSLYMNNYDMDSMLLFDVTKVTELESIHVKTKMQLQGIPSQICELYCPWKLHSTQNQSRASSKLLKFQSAFSPYVKISLLLDISSAKQGENKGQCFELNLIFYQPLVVYHFSQLLSSLEPPCDEAFQKSMKMLSNQNSKFDSQVIATVINFQKLSLNPNNTIIITNTFHLIYVCQRARWW